MVASENQSIKGDYLISILEVTMVPAGGCLFASLVLSVVVSAATSYSNIGTYPPGKEGNACMHCGVSFQEARLTVTSWLLGVEHACRRLRFVEGKKGKIKTEKELCFLPTHCHVFF